MLSNHRLEADASIVLGILGTIATFGDGLNYTFAPRSRCNGMFEAKLKKLMQKLDAVILHA